MKDLTIVEVSEASFFIDKLFEDSFGQSCPRIPSHYIAFSKIDAFTVEIVGYCHATYQNKYGLLGGLCVRPSYRNRRVGQSLVRHICESNPAIEAYFAYAGNPTLVHHVGFIRTSHPNLLVRWMQFLSEEEKTKHITEVASIGSF